MDGQSLYKSSLYKAGGNYEALMLKIMRVVTQLTMLVKQNAIRIVKILMIVLVCLVTAIYPVIVVDISFKGK